MTIQEPMTDVVGPRLVELTEARGLAPVSVTISGTDKHGDDITDKAGWAGCEAWTLAYVAKHPELVEVSAMQLPRGMLRRWIVPAS